MRRSLAYTVCSSLYASRHGSCNTRWPDAPVSSRCLVTHRAFAHRTMLLQAIPSSRFAPRLSQLAILIRHQTDPSSRTAACRLTLRASSVMPSSSSPVFIAVAVYKRVCGMLAVCLPAQRTQRKKRRTTSARPRDDASDAMSRNSRSGTPSIRRLVRCRIVQPLSMPAFWSCT